MTKHRWDKVPTKIAATESADGNARTERECMFCGLTKITVHPPVGMPWREWRTRGGEILRGAATPECVAVDERVAA